MDQAAGGSNARAMFRWLQVALAVLLELALAVVITDQVAGVGEGWLVRASCDPEGLCGPDPVVFLAINFAGPAFFTAWVSLYFGISAWRGRSPAMILGRVPPRSKRPRGLFGYLAGDDRPLAA
jgi:hypothetical protein